MSSFTSSSTWFALTDERTASTFADVVATASSLGDSAIGYRVAASGAVVVNPSKSTPLSLGRDDEILVVAAGSR